MHYLQTDAAPLKHYGNKLAELRHLVMNPVSGSMLESDDFAVGRHADLYDVVIQGTGEQTRGGDARLASRYVYSYLGHVQDNVTAVYRLFTHPDTLNDGRVWYGSVAVHARSIIESAAHLQRVMGADQAERLTNYAQRLFADNSTQDGRVAQADLDSLKRKQTPFEKAAKGAGSTSTKQDVRGKKPTPRDVVREALGPRQLEAYDLLSQHVHHSPGLDDFITGTPFSRGLKGLDSDAYDDRHRGILVTIVVTLTHLALAVERYATDPEKDIAEKV